MTDERCETHVVVELPDAGRHAIHFQEWWIRYRAALPAQAFVQVGLDDAKPAPGVLEAILHADVVLIAPSNPVVVSGRSSAVAGDPGCGGDDSRPGRRRLPHHRWRAGAGHGRRVPAAIGVEVSAEGVGRHYGARDRAAACSTAGWCTSSDTADVPGVAVRSVPLLMSDDDATAAMVDAALELAGV